ncbi:MAG: lipoprotein [Nocardioides sp.]|nr:lipoprotein [Nocardioides sp.]
MRLLLVVLGLTLAGCSHPSAQLSPPKLTSPPSFTPAAPDVGVSSVAIPSIGLNDNLTMQVVKQPDGSLGVPPLTSPRMIGWYRQSPVPGDNSCDHPCVGRSVVVAHINANHVEGAFAELAKVKVGATIAVGRTDAQTATFKVTRTLVIAKSKFPTDDVYGPAKEAELVAITCGPDAYNAKTHNYENQTIVWATLVSLKPTGP